VNDDTTDEDQYRQNDGGRYAYPSRRKHSAKHQPKRRQPNRKTRYPKGTILSLE